MPDKFLYEYAVMRIVPRVEREEFINVGVVLYCAAQGFLHCISKIDPVRLTALAPGADQAEIQQYLDAFTKVCEGDRTCESPIATLPSSSRFRWLTATRSTVLQTSRVHPGFCSDPSQTLARLFFEQVM